MVGGGAAAIDQEGRHCTRRHRALRVGRLPPLPLDAQRQHQRRQPSAARPVGVRFGLAESPHGPKAQ